MHMNDPLVDILDDLQSVLICGELEKIGPLAKRLEDASANLSERLTTQGEMAAINERARKSQILLEASISGVHAARQRLEEILQVRRGLSSYGADGRTRAVLAGETTPLRRF
jgi:hypothetical protein